MRLLSKTLLHSLCFVVFCAALMAFAPAARAEGVDRAVEYRIKAAYLFNFTKFIDWPPAAYAGPDTKFVIGVIDPAGSAADVVQETLRNKVTPSGRPIEVRRFTALTPEVADCHQLFVTRASGITPTAVRSVVGDAPVLVIGETDGFAEQGGVIGFVVSGDGVHCDVNLAGAQRAGVKLSGRFASVARLVRENIRR
ncbi:MAG TPA: YfiR family protein [Opitutaceae bacterium]|nr:YfiR family protein [Opitutaceae bacterium]